jgi:hypothetical protein
VKVIKGHWGRWAGVGGEMLQEFSPHPFLFPLTSFKQRGQFIVGCYLEPKDRSQWERDWSWEVLCSFFFFFLIANPSSLFLSQQRKWPPARASRFGVL